MIIRCRKQRLEFAHVQGRQSKLVHIRCRQQRSTLFTLNVDCRDHSLFMSQQSLSLFMLDTNSTDHILFILDTGSRDHCLAMLDTDCMHQFDYDIYRQHASMCVHVGYRQQRSQFVQDRYRLRQHRSQFVQGQQTDCRDHTS